MKHRVLRCPGCGRAIPACVAAVVLLALGVAAHRPAAAQEALDAATIDASLALGRTFLLTNQRENGLFRYRFNYTTGEEAPEQDQVRQAGALWSLAMFHARQPTPETREAVRRGLDYFRTHSRESEGRRWIVFPGADRGRTGTVALVTLAAGEYARIEGEAAPEERRLWDQLLRCLLSLQRFDRRFYSEYMMSSGEGWGLPSPYYDGEVLLALCHAACRLERDDLRPTIEAAIPSMIASYVTAARKANPDSPLTKGFYQWGSLSMYELARHGWDPDGAYARTSIDLAHWMIDIHGTLDRPGNTGYAYEGIVPAWALAEKAGDARSAAKFRRTIDLGLKRLVGWQVGGPCPNEYLLRNPAGDPAATGGVMGAADDPWLRIDTTQHQMHALMLARELLYR